MIKGSWAKVNQSTQQVGVAFSRNAKRVVVFVAGFAIIEADTLAEAVEMVSRTPCAVAQGVVEVWPLDAGV